MMNNLKQIFFLILCFGIFGASVSTSAQTRAWGGNNGGQLGIDTNTSQLTPFTVSAVPDAVGIAGGYHHTIFLKADGTLMATGRNNEGELGFGTATLPVLKPSAVPNLNGIRQVAAGGYHSVALKTDGTVWSWGFNQQGQIGNHTAAVTPNCSCVLNPAQAINLSNIVQIDAGFYHTLALKADGTVWAWGSNSAGQVGNGTAGTIETKPVQVGVGVAGFENIVAIAGGEYHSMALKADGTVWVWGYNTSGQTGNGSATTNHSNYLPVKNTTLSGVTQIAAGAYHNIALKADGSVWVWGDNTYGQTGNGVNGGLQLVPVQNETLADIVEISAQGSNHTLAKTRSGEIWAWGDNYYGQMGRNTSGNIFNVPLKPFAGSANALIATGNFHNFVSKPSFTTPAGANVQHAGENLSINFSSVTTAGTTAYTAHDLSAASLPLPAGYELKWNAPAYNLTTTALTSGDYTVCLKVPSAASAAEFNRFRILHSENGSFVDRTASSDLRKREICASVSYPGLFVVAQTLAPTAGEVTVSGRVTTQRQTDSGQKQPGVASAVVSLTDAAGNTRTALTSSFGFYSFDNVRVGETYIISVAHKRYQFVPQAVNVNEEITDLNFSPME